VPASPKSNDEWLPHAFARHDAAGLTHYLGIGDVNGDGRPDACTGAKGMPALTGNWFAWWEAPEAPGLTWQKHLIATGQNGATNIHPADLDGDGKTDFLASRGHGEGVVWFQAPDWKEHPIHPSLQNPHSLAVLDIDGDGDTDAATCAYGSKEAWWFENDGRLRHPGPRHGSGRRPRHPHRRSNQPQCRLVRKPRKVRPLMQPAPISPAQFACALPLAQSPPLPSRFIGDAKEVRIPILRAQVQLSE